MREFNEVRLDIENVDLKLKELFLNRMELIEEIKNIKRKNNLPVEDKKREEYLITKYSENVIKYKSEYLDFLNYIFYLSKKNMMEGVENEN